MWRLHFAPNVFRLTPFLAGQRPEEDQVLARLPSCGAIRLWVNLNLEAGRAMAHPPWLQSPTLAVQQFPEPAAVAPNRVGCVWWCMCVDFVTQVSEDCQVLAEPGRLQHGRVRVGGLPLRTSNPV